MGNQLDLSTTNWDRDSRFTIASLIAAFLALVLEEGEEIV